MDASITGEYTSVVKFLNGLQKSPIITSWIRWI